MSVRPGHAKFHGKLWGLQRSSAQRGEACHSGVRAITIGGHALSHAGVAPVLDQTTVGSAVRLPCCSSCSGMMCVFCTQHSFQDLLKRFDSPASALHFACLRLLHLVRSDSRQLHAHWGISICLRQENRQFGFNVGRCGRICLPFNKIMGASTLPLTSVGL